MHTVGDSHDFVEPSRSTTMTDDAGSFTAPGAEKQLSKRGPAFTSAEDLIVARAFIAASENAICGAHQKGRVFKAHMFELYKDMIADATKKTRLSLSNPLTQLERSTLKGELEMRFLFVPQSRSSTDSSSRFRRRS